MFRRKFNDGLLIGRMKDLAKGAQAVATQLQTQLDERNLDDKVLDKIISEAEAGRRALAEALGLLNEVISLSGKYEQDLEVMQSRRKEQREVEAGAITKAKDLTDKTADTGTLVANALDYILSSPSVLSDVLKDAPTQARVMSVDLLADCGRWDALEEWHKLIQEKLAGRQE